MIAVIDNSYVKSDICGAVFGEILQIGLFFLLLLMSKSREMDNKRHRNDSSAVRSIFQSDADDQSGEGGNKKPEQETERNSKEQASQGKRCPGTCNCPSCPSKQSCSGDESGISVEEVDLISFSTPASSSTGAESQRHAEVDKSRGSSPSKPFSCGAESRRPKEEDCPKSGSTSASSSRGAESRGHAEEDRSNGSSWSKPFSCGAESRRPKEEDCPKSGSTSACSSRGAESWGHKEEGEPMELEDLASLCCQLDDLKRLPQCHQNLGPLDFSQMHTVLINVVAFRKQIVTSHEGRDQWRSNFVKMPCSPESSIQKGGMTKQWVKRWDVISKHLGSLAKKTEVSVKDVEEVIIKCNPKYKGEWKFDALSTFDKFVPKSEKGHALFPKIAKLALKLPEEVRTAIPLLRSGHSAAITLSRAQIACLLANAFFCTFPHRNTTSPKAEYHRYPSINFSSLFGNSSFRKVEKLRAIMHYFREVTDDKTDLSGLVMFERRCGSDGHHWESCKETMPKLHVTSTGTIETEGTGMLQVDFACSWIGGGVLSSGLVQEEILFIINPELIVSRLFTEKLNDTECLIITGTQQFSNYSGFADTFEWAGRHDDRLQKDGWGRMQRQILAIDALNFKSRMEQYNMYKVKRELNKAYCGFKGHGDEPDIATGKWGCGAFNGDPQLKALIQLMAAAKARRGLAFFTFGDDKLKKGLEQIYSLLVVKKITVDKLYRFLEDFCDEQHRGSRLELFDFIRRKISHSQSRM